MTKKEQMQTIADKIQPLMMFIDGLVEQLDDEELELLIESKDTLASHISMQHSAMTLTMAFGIETDTTDEEYKLKTLEVLTKLISVRKEYKTAMIENQKKQNQIAKNRAELMQIFGNM